LVGIQPIVTGAGAPRVTDCRLVQGRWPGSRAADFTAVGDHVAFYDGGIRALHAAGSPYHDRAAGAAGTAGRRSREARETRR
jgi:hypothetical protein